MSLKAETEQTEHTTPELHIEEQEDKTIILPPLTQTYFNTIHKLEHFRDYYKTIKAVLHSTYAEISYVNDDGETAEVQHRKATFKHYSIKNNELILNSGEEAF
jgi:hypothetical protein